MSTISRTICPEELARPCEIRGEWEPPRSASAPRPIVVLSGDSNATDVAGAIGAQALLVKPFEFAALTATVRRLARDHHASAP